MHNILQTRIIDPLLTANTDLLNTNEAAITSLVTTVSCGATQLQAGLRETLRNSERLGRTVDKMLLSLIAKVSASEIQLKQARNQVFQATYGVELIKSKVREGEADVAAKQAAVNAADAVVRESEGNVYEGERCIGFLPRWLSKPLCEVFNFQGLNDARNERNRRGGVLEHAHSELRKFRETLAIRQMELARAIGIMNSYESHKNLILQQLATLRERQSNTAVIIDQLRHTITHVSNFLSASTVLLETLKSLVRFDLLIGPLEAIGERIKHTGIPTNITANTLLVILLFVVYAKGDFQALVITSLVDNTGLPPNPLLNPFYDSITSALPRTRRQRSAKHSNNESETQELDLFKQAQVNDIWMTQITDAPSTVNLLGQLMILSSKLDFSFKEHMPNHTFVLIKYKHSFRATLTQIASEGWQTFSTAHQNMDKIQLYMQIIPKHVRTAISVLETAPSARIIGRLLPRTLREIERIGFTCVKLTKNTHLAFNGMMELLAEVISATVNSKSVGEARKREADLKLQANRILEARLANATKVAQQAYGVAKDKAREAHAAYKEARGKIPTSFGKFLQDLGNAFVNVVNTVGPIVVGSLFGGPIGAGTVAAHTITTGGSNPTATVTAQIKLVEVASYAVLYKSALEELGTETRTLFIDATNANAVNSSNFEYAAAVFNGFIRVVGKGSNSKELLTLLKDGTTIANELVNLAKESTPDKKTMAQGILDRIHMLITKVSPLVAAAPPDARSDTTRSQQASSSGGNEKFVAEMAQADLRDAQAREDAYYAEWRAKEDQMTALLVEILSLNLTSVNYQVLIDLMTKAVGLLAEISEKWAQLTAFFSTIANQAQIALKGTLDPFTKTAKDAAEKGLTTEERAWYLNLLKTQSIGIRSQSYVLFILSRTYTDMSNKFLLPRLGGLAKLLSAGNDTQREEMRKELDQASNSTRTEVLALIKERRGYYSQALFRKQREIDKVVAELGGPSKENQAAIAEGKKRRQAAGFVR